MLLVEDEPHVSDVMRLMLERAGYRVVPAASAEEGLAVFGSTPRSIDVVISDVRLPGMDGYEFVNRLRVLKPAVRVILTSGYADEEGRGFPFLRKPFRKELLIDAVREALKETRAEGASAGSVGSGG